MKFSSFVIFSIFLSIISCSKVTTEPAVSDNRNKPTGGIDKQESGYSYPHTVTFKSTGLHGDAFLKDKDCTACHGNDLKGGSSKVSCNSCHTSFPHTEGFEHGQRYVESKSLVSKIKDGECLGCHKGNEVSNTDGQEIKRDKMKSCYDCHSYPHNSTGWTAAGEHGEDYIKEENGDSCKKCHGKDLEGGKSKISCNNCHVSFPHTEQFKNSFDHGKSYFDSEENSSNIEKGECLTCHKDNELSDSGDIVKRVKMKSCQDCHSYPHNSAGWAITGEHGKTFDKDETDVNCLNCHKSNSDFQTRNGDLKSCDECHNGKSHTPPSHNLGLVIGKNSNSYGDKFKKREYHGFDYLKNPENCQACHYEGTKTKSRCGMCHTAIPHNRIEDFNGTGHGKEFQKNPMRCSKCHNNPKSKVKAKTCLDCHEDNSVSPHSDDFGEREVHGFQYNSMSELQRKRECEVCHVPDSALDNCSDCHVKMPHKKGFAKEGDCLGCHDGSDDSKAKHHVEDYADVDEDNRQHPRDYIEDTERCAVCHNDNTDLYTCSDCHDNSEW